jgi:tRNA1Val (adenine37-N6)-methyltransferase
LGRLSPIPYPVPVGIEDALRLEGAVGEDEDLTVLFDRWPFIQASRGYRFGIDSVVLARYAIGAYGQAGAVLDVGAGCGIIGILLAAHMPQAAVTAVEIQPLAADRAVRNTQINGLENRISVVAGDVRTVVAACKADESAQFDLVVSNPPFYRLGSGRVNPDSEKAAARHELHLNMRDLMGVISAVLAPDGHAVVMYPAERLEECLVVLPECALAAEVVVPVQPGPGTAVELYMIDIVHAARRIESCATGSAGGDVHVPGLSEPVFMNREFVTGLT